MKQWVLCFDYTIDLSTRASIKCLAILNILLSNIKHILFKVLLHKFTFKHLRFDSKILKQIINAEHGKISIYN